MIVTKARQWKEYAMDNFTQYTKSQAGQNLRRDGLLEMCKSLDTLYSINSLAGKNFRHDGLLEMCKSLDTLYS